VKPKTEQFIRALLKRLDLDVHRARNVRNEVDFLRNRNVDLVLDVGANVGQFAEFLRSRGYQGRIISFEPIQSVFRSLAATAKLDGNWEAHNFALGEASGETTINVAEFSVYSSILDQTRAATEFSSGATVTHQETIMVRTLDEVASNLSGNLFLKIDTQGYEKQVLQGGWKTLPRLKGILMELPIIHLYQGTWQFHEALEFMALAGFVPAQIHPVNYHSKDNVSLVEVDCLFRPRERDD
jgi:FkbM family methyltransferase